MKTFILALLPLVLTGCTITKQAQVSEASAITGVVRLTYNRAMLQTARTDDYVTQGTATKECQRSVMPTPWRLVSRCQPVAYMPVLCA